MPMQPRPSADTVRPDRPSRRVGTGSGVMARSWLTHPGRGHTSAITVIEDARAMQDELVQLRRTLHRMPELGLQLPRTQERVLAALDGLPLEISIGTSTTSVTGVLRGTAESAGAPRSVLLRGDMDALPVAERS